MNLDFTAEEKLFQLKIRGWLEKNVSKTPSVEITRDGWLKWDQTLASGGVLATGWPKEYGGSGWTATQRYIWGEESARAGAPGNSTFGITMCGPVIMAYGTPEQKAEHLPHIVNGTRLWCQGYSEPGAGSDLAALKTRADRDGGHYVVNGQKIWSTAAHVADWCFCLVRTSTGERKQEGISFLLIDMKSPGIEIRPIVTIDGYHHLNEIFFKDVRVPIRNRVGDEGKGWTIAKYLLGHERTMIAGVPESKQFIQGLKSLVARDPGLADHPTAARKIGELEVELMALEYTNLRALERAEQGVPPGPESSGLKIKGSELQQALNELRVELGGYASMPWKTKDIGVSDYAGAVEAYNFNRASTIYGGTNEIQKNVLAKFALGL